MIEHLKTIRVHGEYALDMDAQLLKRVLAERGYAATDAQCALLAERWYSQHGRSMLEESDVEVFYAIARYFEVVGKTKSPKQLDMDVHAAQEKQCATCGVLYGGWCECGF